MIKIEEIIPETPIKDTDYGLPEHDLGDGITDFGILETYESSYRPGAIYCDGWWYYGCEYS